MASITNEKELAELSRSEDERRALERRGWRAVTAVYARIRLSLIRFEGWSNQTQPFWQVSGDA